MKTVKILSHENFSPYSILRQEEERGLVSAICAVLNCRRIPWLPHTINMLCRFVTSKINTKCYTVYMFIIASIYSCVAYTMKELDHPHQAVRCSWFELLVVSQLVSAYHIASNRHQFLCKCQPPNFDSSAVLWSPLCGVTHTVKTLFYILYHHWAHVYIAAIILCFSYQDVWQGSHTLVCSLVYGVCRL